jgi:hypothetical protein
MAAQKFNVTRGISNPWLKDAVSSAVAVLAMSRLPGTPLERVLPPFTVALSLLFTVNKIVDMLEEDAPPLARKTAAAIVTIGGVTILSVLPLPMPLIAASVAGTKLMVDSITDELVGNWFEMLERIGPERLNLPRRLYNNLYRKFQRKFLYPAREALEEIEAFFLNSTALEKNNGISLSTKVKDAVSRNLRLRLMWYTAASGVVFQLLVMKRMDVAMSSFLRKWWGELKEMF